MNHNPNIQLALRNQRMFEWVRLGCPASGLGATVEDSILVLRSIYAAKLYCPLCEVIEDIFYDPDMCDWVWERYHMAITTWERGAAPMIPLRGCGSDNEL